MSIMAGEQAQRTLRAIHAEYDGALARAFGTEYQALSIHECKLLRRDYMLAYREDDCEVSEYQRRIGTGNLHSYVECLQAGERRRRLAAGAGWLDHEAED